MRVREGVDYVHGPPPGTIRRAGKRFVCRYLSEPGNPKNLTAAEARRLHRAGLDVVLVFETTARRALAGMAAGRQDARSVREQLHALGAGAHQPVYFAVDFDTSDLDGSGRERLRDYFRGLISELGHHRTGVYGGRATIETCASLVRLRWQTYAWSGGVWLRGCQLQQYRNGVALAGYEVDLDRALAHRFGAWRAPLHRKLVAWLRAGRPARAV